VKPSQTNIAWTDTTWNPVHGCSRVSKGCTNCYAERQSRQYEHTEKPWTPENASENVSLKPEKLEDPYKWNEPVRVFVNSMSDLFHSEVPDEFIRDVFAVMRNCPHHVFQILTKRPGRAAHMKLQWPPNVWMGTSVEDAQAAERIDLLRDCNAETLFVSFEPLVGPVGAVDLADYDWAIVGGESGPDADRREMDHEWARKIRQQCDRDDVAFFFKQSSARQPERGTALTVEREYGDKTVYEQREIREIPDLHEAVVRAREARMREVTA